MKVIQRDSWLFVIKFTFNKHLNFQVGNLSKRIIVCEAEKSDLKTQIESLRLNYDELLRKHNDCTAEMNHRVKLEEHLNKTGELKRKMDEQTYLHKHELDHSLNKVQALEEEKKELSLKNASLLTENRQLSAENQVLDKALK
jgi:chromosome segregation ATPase